MYNQLLATRLHGVWSTLKASYASGAKMSSATKGREREDFVNEYLQKVLPPAYRFGHGDIIDSFGNATGQQDIVLEHSFFPTLPAIAGKERLYLAEGVAALIEVKSNVAREWDDVERKAAAAKKLRRVVRAPSFTPYGPPSEEIPFFAVGYEGWAEMKTLQTKVEQGQVDAIPNINSGLFCTKKQFFVHQAYSPDGKNNITGYFAREELALWGFICCLQYATVSIALNSFSPLGYAVDSETKSDGFFTPK